MSLFKSLFSFSKKEIDHAFKDARVIKGIPGLKLLQTPTRNIEHGKLLIITPRKLGKAHDRNKIRRRIKAIFFESKLYEKPVVSIILVYKETISTTFKDLKSFLVEAIGAYKS